MLIELLHRTGLVAILRGITSAEVAAVGDALFGAGFRILEVPLNSKDAIESIRILRAHVPRECLVGAGTVTTPAQVDAVRIVGGELIVMPHSDPNVIRAAKVARLSVMPGVATPSEAFAALTAGADALKMFPAELLGPAVLKAWRAVLPAETALVPVGGITQVKLASFVAAGATGVGLGSALYAAGSTPAEVATRAAGFVDAWNAARDWHGDR
ncbi:MAG TPA: 2-dehydro-3-deoxy-6-phosphogalactonate aldolase [Kofleriaceae bacterium]|nr:2-dehydro-3-deoxy-6-phosphogalactonate aldolase [Kofleriaceae bacterium]